ncbi:BTAD domain-containing putative transcriptional regulator [Actinoplanes sp. HUAS TT8]|uniref:AfsR/SARP family transcriptional regulator n=1 Tax=Actinoplanes sp. HUAS TT8 TaxID=3447453 RepID=UPI003F525709
MTGSAVRLQIMGPLRVWRGDREVDAGPRQQRCLLALLAAQAGRPLSMADLIDLMWGSGPPVSAVNVVHKYIGALRRRLEPGLAPRSPGTFLTRHATGYRLTAGPEILDLVAFRALVIRAGQAARAGRADEALDDYTAALALGQGAAGDSLADTTGATAAFAAIDGEFFAAAVAATDVAVRTGRPSRVLGPLRLAARMGRLHEPVHAALVTALGADGQQAEAIEVYRALREHLADELGLDPGRDLQEAQHRVLTRTAAGPPAAEVVPAPRVRPAQLPPDQPMFVGRAHELAVLHDLVHGMRDSRRAGPMVIAVDGLGGVGKSTLVTHFAHQVAAGFTDGQLYLDLRGHDDEDGGVAPDDALRSLLYGLGLRTADIPDTYGALIGVYRSLTAGKRILLLLDDVRDAAQARLLLPSSVESLVLISSRRPLVGLAASDGARLYRAEVPGLPDARQMLTTRLAMAGGAAARTADAVVLDDVIELCGRLPLALAILAARLCVRSTLSLASVAAELRDGDHRLAAFPQGPGLTDPRTAFAWSYRQLKPDTARLFRLLSVALTPGITVEACVSLSGQDAGRTGAELAELTEAALVSEDDHGCFTSHVLVTAYAQELFRIVDPVTDQRAATTRLLQHYLHSSFNAQVMLEPNRPPIAPPPPEPGVRPERPGSYAEAIAWFDRHREVLKEAVRVAADLGDGIVPWQLAITMQQSFEWSGNFQDWEQVMGHALRAARERGDVVGEAHVLRSLAGARWFLGAGQDTLDLLNAALRVFVDRGMLLEQALTEINFHAAYTALGDHESALHHAERAAALGRADGNDTQQVRSLDCVGRSLARLGQHERAARVLDQALDLNLRVGRRHEEAMIRVSIAHNLVDLGRPDDAVHELRLAVKAARSVGQGPYHFEAFRSLAELLLTTGDPDGAGEAFRRASEVLDSFQGGGPRHMRAELRTLAAKMP